MLQPDWSKAPDDATHYTDARNGIYPMWWRHDRSGTSVLVIGMGDTEWQEVDYPPYEYAVSRRSSAFLTA
jgi:hypothetical protein